MLTERQSRILEFVISEYVESASPVASQFIGQKYPVGASPATIRNEMAELEEQGYLNQPHTSSGRIPTDRGYRFYVESLMHEEELSWDEQQTIRHQFHQVEHGQEAWTQLAASVLAQAVENAALVTVPRRAACRVKHRQRVSRHDFTVLRGLVLDESRLKEQVLTLDEIFTQDELTETATRLIQRFAGSSAAEVVAADPAMGQVERLVMDAVIEIMSSVDAGSFDEAHLEGLRHVLSQPEFSSSDQVLALLELLDEHNISQALPLRSLARGGVTVIIGADNPQLPQANDAMRTCSVIVGTYGAPGDASGALAVVGPTRMRYSRTISTVRYLAGVMSELLAEHYE